MSAEKRLRLEEEARNQSVQDQLFSSNLEIEDLQNKLLFESQKSINEATDVNQKIININGCIGLLVKSVVALKKGFIATQSDIQGLEAKTTAIEGLLSNVIDKIEKNQIIEDQIASFICEMQNVILKLAREVSDLTGNKFNEDEFKDFFSESLKESEKIILPSSMIKSCGFYPEAMQEARNSLLNEFISRVKDVEALDFSKTPPVFISGENLFEGMRFENAIKFKNRFYDKISKEDFESFLDSIEGEEYLKIQQNLISCYQKGRFFGTLFLALDEVINSDFLNKNINAQEMGN